MKKILISLLATFAMTTAHADEGMWTLYNLPTAIYEQMKQEGFQLPMEQLYLSDNAIKNNVINFSGYCSGVVVSPNGLVFTNHHCGFDAIRRHSTVEHDYMLNGFVANSYEEELPNEDIFVSFMIEQKDVTDQIVPQLKGMSMERQAEYVDSLENAWQKDIRQQDSTLRVEVKPFYEGNAYYMTTYRDFYDVRLVFTVPKSMGKYGGETDNWMWPRQTCDYSVFRIYADPKTNGPAKYSKDNVPYHPASWAPVSLQGYKPGDFAMIMGYPGSTSRYLSSYGIQERRDAMNKSMIQVRGVKQEIMWVTSGAMVLVVCAHMYQRTRMVLLSIVAFFLTAFILPVMILGYNIYAVRDAWIVRKYTDNYIRTGVLFIGGKDGYGIRDRYGIVVPTKYKEIVQTDWERHHVKVTDWNGNSETIEITKTDNQ